MTHENMGDAAADEVKKRDWSRLSEGAKKEMADKGEFNCFTI